MKVHLYKDGKQYGPYTVEQLRQYVQRGNFTSADHACFDGRNWVTVGEVPGFAAGGDSVTTPQQDQAVQEQAPSADISSPPSKKKKIILLSSMGGVATLLVAGLLIWLLGGGESVQDAQTEARPESNESSAEIPAAKTTQVAKSPQPVSGSIAENIKGKRIVFRASVNKEVLLQFERDGTFYAAKIVDGEISPDEDGMTYRVDGLKVRITENGKEQSEGVTFASNNPKMGDKILFGDEGREKIWSILKIEPAVPLENTPPMQSKTGLGQMLFGLQHPLTDQEKLMVGRWREFDMDEPNTPRYHSIFRSDRSYTYFHNFPATDDKGNEIAGKIDRLLAHGIWKIGDNRIYYLDLVHNGEKLEEADVWINELKSLTKDAYRAEEIFEGGEATKFRGVPVEEFEAPEMLPYNNDAALRSLDIRKAYNSAKGKGTEQINIFFSSTPEPSKPVNP